MKFNKWTLGLAAVGVVSLASAARADEKVSSVNTALSNTTLSGYVDVGAQYVNATGAPYSTAAVGDGLSLNTVDIALDKPMDAAPFSAGYHIELWTGAGVTGPTPLATGSLVRQAYLALGTTIGGQEIDWKIGVWDTIIGYEGLTSSANPNYTHSYGFAVEPTTHTGVQASYKVNDSVTIQGGLADDSASGGIYSAAINGIGGIPGGAIHRPTTMVAVALTAPDSFGPLKGSTLTIGGMNTAGAFSGFTDSLYMGATIPTSNADLKFGAAWDYVDGAVTAGSGHINVEGIYATYQASTKLNFNVRGEVYEQTAPFVTLSKNGEEFTVTASYALWANVLSRAEIRWDHAENAAVFAANTASAGPEKNAILLAAQLIYTF